MKSHYKAESPCHKGHSVGPRFLCWAHVKFSLTLPPLWLVLTSQPSDPIMAFHLPLLPTSWEGRVGSEVWGAAGWFSVDDTDKNCESRGCDSVRVLICRTWNQRYDPAPRDPRNPFMWWVNWHRFPVTPAFGVSCLGILGSFWTDNCSATIKVHWESSQHRDRSVLFLPGKRLQLQAKIYGGWSLLGSRSSHCSVHVPRNKGQSPGRLAAGRGRGITFPHHPGITAPGSLAAHHTLTMGYSWTTKARTMDKCQLLPLALPP